MNIAIILAGGNGSRISNELPKQFITISDRSILEHSIDAFEKNNHIDKIAIVMNEDYLSYMDEIIMHNAYTKIDKIIKGGKERYESSWNAIKEYAGESDCNFIFHDAARPLVSQRIIDETVAALGNYNAVAVAIPSTDTIYNIDTQNNVLKSVPERNGLYCAQTPQAFNISTIRKAYELFLKSTDFMATDDIGIVSKFIPEEKIYIVNGDKSNIKITYAEDVDFARHLLELA